MKIHGLEQHVIPIGNCNITISLRVVPEQSDGLGGFVPTEYLIDVKGVDGVSTTKTTRSLESAADLMKHNLSEADRISDIYEDIT